MVWEKSTVLSCERVINRGNSKQNINMNVDNEVSDI